MAFADRRIQCDACFAQCNGLLAEGKKEHAASCRLCVDCAECEKIKDAKHMAACAKACRDTIKHLAAFPRGGSPLRTAAFNTEVSP